MLEVGDIIKGIRKSPYTSHLIEGSIYEVIGVLDDGYRLKFICYEGKITNDHYKGFKSWYDNGDGITREWSIEGRYKILKKASEIGENFMENVKIGDMVTRIEENDFLTKFNSYEIIDMKEKFIVVVDDNGDKRAFYSASFQNKYYKKTIKITPENKTGFDVKLDIEITKDMNNLTKGKRYNILDTCNVSVLIENDNNEKKFYLAKNFTKVIKKCEDCDEIFENDSDIIFDAEKREICQDCRDESYFVCDDCGELHNLDDENYIERSEVSVCTGCLNSNYKKCADCDEYTKSGQHVNGDNICSCCIENDYFYCDQCGDYYHNDRYGSDGWCEDCTEEENSRAIKSWDYRPTFKPEGDNSRYFGMEIEVERSGSSYSRTSVAEDISEIGDRIYCKNDGSLNNGFEIVTQPCNLVDVESSETLSDLKEAMEIAQNANFKSHNTSSCGLHIHASKNSLTERQIAYLHEFFSSPKNDKFIELIARRNYGTYTNKNRKMLMKEKRGKKHFGENRYVAFNTIPQESVEFRVFKGTLVWSTVKATLHLVDHLINFSAKCKLREIRDFKHFLMYLKNVDTDRVVRNYITERLEKQNKLSKNLLTAIGV